MCSARASHSTANAVQNQQRRRQRRHLVYSTAEFILSSLLNNIEYYRCYPYLSLPLFDKYILIFSLCPPRQKVELEALVYTHLFPHFPVLSITETVSGLSKYCRIFLAVFRFWPFFPLLPKRTGRIL
jgi:hypothetical protein